MLSKNHINILIVDDEINVIRSIIRTLDKPEYRFAYTIYPEKGLDLINNNEFDIVICDQKMPNVTGVDFFRHLKVVSPKTVRILITGYTDIDIVISSINEGSVFKYIAKPWDNEKFERIIEEAVEYKEELEQSNKNAINGLLRIMMARDKEIYEHGLQVSNYSMLIAEAIGLTEARKWELKYAGIFHDIGKIAMREDILYKPSKLDKNEFELMKNHSLVGAEILSEFEFMKDISTIVCQHHEKINGRGYPYGLENKEILLEAKILAIADCYDALVSNRIYRKRMSVEEAINILLQEVNESYDRELVNKFIEILLSNQEPKDIIV